MSELKPCQACGSEDIITGCGGLRAICKKLDCQMTGPRKMGRADTGTGEMIDWNLVAILCFYAFVMWLVIRSINK